MDKLQTTKTGVNSTAGIWYGVSAFITWGVLPFYWKLLDSVPPHEILAHRIFWSFICMACLLFATGGWRAVTVVLTDKKKLFLVFASGFIISINWFTYIYAVNSNHLIEASMGYFINPLVMIFLGVTILKEKLTRWQCTAILLAFIGVLIVTVQYGRVPWIALSLAISFPAYGLMKKLLELDSITGLALETFAVMPFALGYIVFLELKGNGALSTLPAAMVIILVGTGVVTSGPLLLFAQGVRLNKLSMMGFMQYITPSISLLLGIFVFREHFTLTDLISFCFIWAGLAIFTLANAGVLVEKKAAARSTGPGQPKKLDNDSNL